MATMYDTLMDLPIFKGASKEQISAFLEKTHISFRNYNDGDIIIPRSSSVGNVMFIITGNVRISHFIGDHYPGEGDTNTQPIVLSELCTTGVFIGGDYLFGMSTTYPIEATSVGKSSILEFSKEQFLRALQSETIYLLNYLNYLSYRSQRSSKALRQLSDATLEHRLALYIFSLTSSQALEIEIGYTPTRLSGIIGIPESKLEDSLSRLARKHMLKYTPASIQIPSRRNFLDYIMERETTA